MKLVKPSVEVVWYIPELIMTGTQFIVKMGRISHKSKPNYVTNLDSRSERFIKMIKKKGHNSVLEFGEMAAIMTISRAIADELRTHRLTSCIMQSTRYCNYSKDKFDGQVSFIRLDHRYDDNVGAIYQAYDRAEQSYMQLIHNGVKPEIARDVLPLGVATEFGIKANFREWMHIFKLRCDSVAHPDMRMIMEQIRDKAVERYPAVFGE